MRTSDISVQLIDVMGSDLSVVNAARVSFDKESDWENAEYGHKDFELPNYLKASDTKLIQYLAKHKHYSPFNHTFLSFRVKAPIFVARQLVKHEYLPWNEVSRRYVDSEPEFYFPKVWRAKADNVKQGSSDESVDINIYHGTQGKNGIEDPFSDAVEICLEAYHTLLDKDVCPEQARMVLPQNTMTEWIWSGTLKAFHKMLSLRLDTHSQYETRLVAEQILPLIEAHFPISIKSLLEST